MTKQMNLVGNKIIAELNAQGAGYTENHGK